jgi:HPt (histidine-containing phosphotransfer) domain-containing protein
LNHFVTLNIRESISQPNITIFVTDFFLESDNFSYPAIMDYKFINTEYLDSVSGGDPEITRELVNMFREQIIEIFDEMKKHFSSANYILLGQLAHKAKSSVAIMGMDDLAIMLKTFELQAKEGKESQLYESYILRFKTETEAAVIELEDFIKNRTN